ncbi:MAG: hypothetical protein WC457_02255 [Patescibacteria group bacterium]
MNLEGQKYSSEMVSLMIEALGGDAQVEKIVKQKRIAAVVKAGTTVGEACDKAQEEGWLDWFRAMTMGEMAAMLGGKGSSQKASGTRMNKEEVVALCGKVIAFLQGKPGTRVGEISSAVGAESIKVAAQLRKLITEGKVRSEGAKIKTVYFLK